MEENKETTIIKEESGEDPKETNNLSFSESNKTVDVSITETQKQTNIPESSEETTNITSSDVNMIGEPISPECSEDELNLDDSSENVPNDDPYAYLDRNGFTSEKFKLEIRCLPKYYGMKELKKLLNDKLKLKCSKIKVPSLKGSWIYICFRCEEDKMNAFQVLNNYTWKGSCLKVEEAKPVPDPLVQKRIQDSSDNGPVRKKLKMDESEVLEKVKTATIPMWNIPYEEQLKKKTELIKNLLRQYSFKLAHANTRASKWFKNQKSKYDNMPCEVCPIRRADEYIGYRNKCEFTIGINEATGEKTIGFRLGKYGAGSLSVGPVDEIESVPERMKMAVKAFEKFIQASQLDVFNQENHKGHWRQLTVRYGFRTDQLMLIIGITPQKMTDSELNDLKNQIKDFFTSGEGKDCGVTSLYIHLIKRRQNHDEALIYDHFYGDTHITEKILGQTFRISPQAFFQVNTKGAEILYKTIGEMAGLSKDVTLLDICCGTGTIGICLSEQCAEVLGLEMSIDAINDARVNAKNNDVSNAQFFVGKAENVLSWVAQKSTQKEIVAVADPPRAGLQNSALLQIRRNQNINKLVYVSCNPRGALKDFIDLGRATSKVYRGDPFLPIKAIPVDLFPFTNHCELLIYFERHSL